MLSSQHSRSGTTPARGNTNLSADSQPPLPTSAAVAQGAPDQLVQVVRGLRERVKELEDNISELKRENNQKMVEMEHRWNSEFQALKGTLLSEVKLLTAKAQGKETRPSSNEERQVTAADDGPEKGSRGLNSQRRQDHYVGHRPDRSDGRDEKNSGMPFQTRVSYSARDCKI
jgi:regulator of replication initiation timing